MPRRLASGALAALIAGVAHAASFAPAGAWWLQVAALAALVALVLLAVDRDDAGPKRAAALGFAFGLGWFVAGVAWLYVSMHRYGGMPAPLAALALLLFGAYLALFPAAACAFAARALRGARGATAQARGALAIAVPGLGFAGAWTLAELARGYLFTGFPWLAAGYAHVDGPLAGFAPLLGVYGIGAFAALSAYGLGAALAARRGAATATAAVLVAAPLAAGWALSDLQWSQPAGRALAVRLLQGNVAQDMKFDPARSLAAMRAYAAEAARAPADLTVLPETAWTVPWPATPAPLRAALREHLARSGGAIAIGMPLPERAGGAAAAPRLTNSVAVIDGAGALAARYDKRHLVPFGEFVPRGFGWFVALMEIPLGEFGRGARSQPPLDIGGQRVAFDICYEDLFGEELAVQVRDGATILVNVSNIAWFGDSLALPQHLQIARMRALELARPMLRATNTGVTAAIDARGRVIDALPVHAAGALTVSLRGSTGLTPFARWANAPALALALALTAAGARPARMTRVRVRPPHAADHGEQTR